jgi:hypothetical protein
MAASTPIAKAGRVDELIDQMAANIDEIRKTISTLHEPGALIELCGIKEGGIDCGYYDDHNALAHDAKKLSDSGEYAGVYITLNPVKCDVPERLGYKKNQINYDVKNRTKDKDIDCRRWLPLDFDPVRPSNTSATDRQKGATSWCRSFTVGLLRERHIPEPIMADSGNGWYALYRTDEPNNEATALLFKNATKAIAERCSIPDVATVDSGTHNASRLIKLFGTRARKGENTHDAPHRFSRLDGVPKNLRIVSREQLEELANAVGTKKSPQTGTTGAALANKVEEFLKRAAIDVKSTHELPDGGKQWVLAQCWFKPEHKDAAVFANSAGLLTYCCFHEVCGDNTNRWKDFLESVEEKLGERFDLPRGSSVPYEMIPAEGIIHHTYTRSGDHVCKPLTNFTARIVANIEVDDGVETKNNLEIEAVLKNRTTVFSMPSSEFATMNWALDKLGGEAIIAPGAGSKDHARFAIQHLSGDIDRRTVYTHTGWRRIGSEWFYLHGDGAIGQEGLCDSLKVKLPPNLAPFRLAEPPAGEKLKAAILASLRLLDVAPLSCTLPIYASIWRALLGDSDFSVHATGLTGTFKTSVSALAMQHFGAGFDVRHVPGAWSSTANANAALQFVLKDALFLIDDFVPKGSSSDVERQHRDADRIFRGQGNTSGRGRLGRDGTSLYGANPPRGLTLSTGEDVPRGQSLNSRFWLVEFSPDDVDVKKLTDCQADASAGFYSQAMSAFLKWLAPQYTDVKNRLPKQIDRFRAAATRSGQHARTPEIVANFMVGLSSFLRFATAVGALSGDEAKTILTKAWQGLGKGAAAQARGQAAEEPTLRFLNLIAALIDRGDACLRKATAPEPSDGEKGRCIGWTTDDRVLLEPESAYAAVHQLAAQQGEAFPVRCKTLGKRLEQRRFLTHHDKNRNTIQVTIGAARRRVWSIKTSHIFPPLGETQIGDEDDSGPVEAT